MDLRAVIRYCAREGYIPKNYMADVQKLISRVIPPDEYKALTDEELHDIVDAFENDNKMKLQVLLLFNCGLRPGELYGLQFSDFDYEAKKVSIRRALSIDLHRQFVYIHPFEDGNGRTARLMMNAALMQAGYEIAVIPPICRADYIHALKIGRKDPQKFTKFIAEREWETQKDMARFFHLSLQMEPLRPEL